MNASTKCAKSIVFEVFDSGTRKSLRNMSSECIKALNSNGLHSNLEMKRHKRQKLIPAACSLVVATPLTKMTIM